MSPVTPEMLTVFPDEFKTRMKAILNNLDEVYKMESFQRRNAARRRLHCENETLLMDFEDQGSALGLKPAETAEVLGTIAKVRKELELETMPISTGTLTTLFMFARMSAFLTVLMTGGAINMMTLPIRYTLHPVLKRLGVRNENLPLDVFNYFLCVFAVVAAGVRFRVEGLEGLGSRPYIGLFTHPSSLDPFLILASTSKQPKMIGKLEVFLIPVLGWGLRFGMGCIQMNR
ncbi:hypothetical protein CYMTET_45171, partial [Cymbomonas tetramitiformis]